MVCSFAAPSAHPLLNGFGAGLVLLVQEKRLGVVSVKEALKLALHKALSERLQAEHEVEGPLTVTLSFCHEENSAETVRRMRNTRPTTTYHRAQWRVIDTPTPRRGGTELLAQAIAHVALPPNAGVSQPQVRAAGEPGGQPQERGPLEQAPEDGGCGSTSSFRAIH